MRRCCAYAATIVASFAVWVSVAEAHEKRFITPDDLLQMERIPGEQINVSPDGQTVAFVRCRPSLTALKQADYEFDYDQCLGYADVWAVDAEHESPVNLTNGESEGAGYWRPTWSPDGTRLALLSTRDGRIGLWVWEKATKRLTRLTNGAVRSLMWLDSERLVALVPSEDEHQWSGRSGEVIAREWKKKWVGSVPTSSVLDAGVFTELPSHNMPRLAVLHVTTGVVRITDFRATDLSVSPDGQHVATMVPLTVAPVQKGPLPSHDRRRYRMQIVNANDLSVSFDGRGLENLVVPSLRWSPNGNMIGVIGTTPATGDTQAIVQIATDGVLTATPLPDAEPHALVWLDAKRVLASSKRDGDKREHDPKYRWWMLSGVGEAVSVSAPDGSILPGDLTRVADGAFFVGLANDTLWCIDSASMVWTNISAKSGLSVTGVSWPNSDLIGHFNCCAGGREPTIVVSQRRPKSFDTTFYSVDVVSGLAVKLLDNAFDPLLLTYIPAKKLAIVLLEVGDAIRVVAVHDRKSVTKLEINGFLREITPGELRHLSYRSLDGAELKAWLILPVDYESGRRYPLVTWVYPGWMARDEASDQTQLHHRTALNLQLFAAHGYAVLVPSMPLPSLPGQRADQDPYLEVINGVMPAVDKAIDIGIADPAKLAIAGHSFGGYATLALLSLTTRFRAAISLAGPSDLISLYGTFNSDYRYTVKAHEYLQFPDLLETGQVGLGASLSENLWSYIRNTPLFYVDRIQTPLLIIQGDMDPVALTQGEEFFTALQRRGKRARFIRYWGEGHAVTSPANIRDLWRNIYVWLDELLKPSEATTARQASPR